MLFLMARLPTIEKSGNKIVF